MSWPIAIALLIVAGLYFGKDWLIYLGLGMIALPIIFVLIVFIIIVAIVIISYISDHL